MTDHQPPAAVEAEQAILGALLLYPDAIDRIHWLGPAHFYTAAHRTIYQGILDSIEAGEPLDALTLGDRLRRGGLLEAAGGVEYLTQLVTSTASAANITHHAKRVREAALLRETAAVAQEVAAEAMHPGARGEEIAEAAIARLDALLETRESSEVVPMIQAARDAVDWLESPEQGITTGFADIDHQLFRLREGDLVVIAGRPSMGKSTLAQNMAEHVAEAGYPAAIFSLEMSARQLGVRAVKWHERGVGRGEALRKLAGLPLYIDDGAEVTVGRLRLKARRLKRKHGLRVLVVDYIQLMQGDHRAENRNQEIGGISRGLKRLAKELGITVIAVAQLNRAVEARTDKRPLMSDLRESGDIEQDADVIAMVYRDDYYNDATDYPGVAEVIVRKHREGPTGTEYLTFLPEYPRFENYAGDVLRPSSRPTRRRGAVIDFKTKAGGDG